MTWLPRNIAGLVVLSICGLVLVGCKRRGEAAKSDLGEAGYQLTAEDWFRACRGNDASALKKFTATRFDTTTRNSEGDTGLHVAAAGGAKNSAEFLLKNGLEIDIRGGFERTPLQAAVLADQTEMVRWMLRQGADPLLKDKDGFKPLMLAVREGKAGSVAELGAYDRQELDPALLLAALVGRADVIDALTNFGASVYARMEDGRTPLMVAAENGHTEAVQLLLDLGAGRFTATPEGKTAADLATAAGHPEIAALISKAPQPAELALESPAEIAESMDAYVDHAVAKFTTSTATSRRSGSVPLEGETLSGPVASPPAVGGSEAFAMPPLVMRHYREKEIPVSLHSVVGDTATVSITGAASGQMKVKVGETIPGTRLLVVRMKRRMEDSKVNLGKPSEISVIEVRDRTSGQTREWISGFPAAAHDPLALVEDAATGKRYLAAPGQHFRGADGVEYLISDVRPNQMVIQEVATGAVQTIPLRGPRG